LIGLLKKSQENGPFEDIVGYEDVKRLFGMALESRSRTHILLAGPPASAKTMFLTSLLQFLKNAYFVDGANTTKAGMIEYLFENRPEYLLLDELDKSAPKHQTFLLNLMETGIISETKFGKPREMTINTSVFATTNDITKLSGALRSRFFVVQMEPYTYEEFYGITLSLLHDQAKVAPTIADAVW